MRSRLSIRNFKYLFRDNAGIAALCLIVLVEVLAHPYLAVHFFSHEVDRTLHLLKKPLKSRPILVLGDSVGHGIFAGWKLPGSPVTSLACNQATETAGQYFFLKRYLRYNRVPGAVISCDRTPFEGNLSQNLTENYIQRCFTQWNEIVDLFLVKMDPVFSVKMVAYKFFPTLKYRLHLQEKFFGFTTNDIYSGLNPASTTPQAEYGLLQVLHKILEKQRTVSVSEVFLGKLLQQLQQLGVPFYYLPPPTQKDNGDTHGMIRNSIRHFSKFSALWPDHILSNCYQRYDGDFFSDGVHLNQAGLELHRRHLLKTMEGLASQARTTQQTLRDQALQRGVEIWSLQVAKGDQLVPLRDITLRNGTEGIDMVATGGDPSLILTELSGSKGGTGRMVVRVNLASDTTTRAKLYYSAKSPGTFAENQSIASRISVGDNTLYFVLPEHYKEGVLRFDPGETSGSFQLRSIEVRIVDSESFDLYFRDV